MGKDAEGISHSLYSINIYDVSLRGGIDKDLILSIYPCTQNRSWDFL
jgi:hypothetical protein